MISNGPRSEEIESAPCHRGDDPRRSAAFRSDNYVDMNIDKARTSQASVRLDTGLNREAIFRLEGLDPMYCGGYPVKNERELGTTNVAGVGG